MFYNIVQIIDQRQGLLVTWRVLSAKVSLPENMQTYVVAMWWYSVKAGCYTLHELTLPRPVTDYIHSYTVWEACNSQSLFSIIF